MGWKSTALILIIALWALGAGALIIGLPLLLYLLYGFWSKHRNSPWRVYIGLFLVVLSLVAALRGGTFSPIVFGAAGVGFLAPGTVRGLFQRALEEGAELFDQIRRTRAEGGAGRPCVELTRVPLDYLDSRKADPEERLLKFQRLTQALAELGGAVEFRLDFSESSGRMVFAMAGRNERNRADGLLQVLKSQLPEFAPNPSVEQPAADGPFEVLVEGIPEPSADPLGPLARFFVENRLAGGYSVVVSPARVDPLSRWLAGGEQKGLAQSSGYQRADNERTTTMVDHHKQVELEESVKRLERLSARTPIRVSVRVFAREEVTAVRAAHVLAGTLSSQRRISGFSIGRPRASEKVAWRRSTLILPSEAAPFFWLPQTSLGLPVAPSAEFQAPPPSEGEIVLGEVATLSGRSGQKVKVPLDQLAKHLFVTGMTGSGKTTSCFALLLQLHRRGVPFLVVEPVKSEYRSLLATIPELQVFTIGDEGTAPFRLNIFEPPPGVKVQAHLENLEAVWNSSFVSYAPLPYVVKQVFAEAYRACGWDVARNIGGRPVMFEDVRAEVEKVVRGLGYERDVTMDVEAALKTRLTSLSLGSKGSLLGAASSTPLDLVFERPTVIELKEIQNDEEKAFVAALLLMDMAAWAQVRGQSKRLRHFTLIEEAHRLLPNVSTEKGDPESTDPRRRTVEQFANMLAELRAYGEGLAVVEQIPTKILPDAIKNTATKVVHRVAALDDRRAMAGAMNATKEQAAVFTALRPGEAVLSIEGHPVPVRVEVDDVVARFGVPVGEVSEADVKERMTGFYTKYPLSKETAKPFEARMRETVDTAEFREGFLEAYRLWAKGDARPLRDFLIVVARRMGAEKDMVETATKILSLAAAFYLPFSAEERARFPRMFRQELVNAGR